MGALPCRGGSGCSNLINSRWTSGDFSLGDTARPFILPRPGGTLFLSVDPSMVSAASRLAALLLRAAPDDPPVARSLSKSPLVTAFSSIKVRNDLLPPSSRRNALFSGRPLSGVRSIALGRSALIIVPRHTPSWAYTKARGTAVVHERTDHEGGCQERNTSFSNTYHTMQIRKPMRASCWISLFSGR